MARIIKEEEYNARRDEILAVGLSLVYTKGYGQMTIQDILDGLGISRGAFYHYFASKQALLEALVERLGRQAEQLLLPIVQDPHLAAVEKFCRFFEALAHTKHAKGAGHQPHAPVVQRRERPRPPENDPRLA